MPNILLLFQMSSAAEAADIRINDYGQREGEAMFNINFCDARETFPVDTATFQIDDAAPVQVPLTEIPSLVEKSPDVLLMMGPTGYTSRYHRTLLDSVADLMWDYSLNGPPENRGRIAFGTFASTREMPAENFDFDAHREFERISAASKQQRRHRHSMGWEACIDGVDYLSNASDASHTKILVLMWDFISVGAGLADGAACIERARAEGVRLVAVLTPKSAHRHETQTSRAIQRKLALETDGIVMDASTGELDPVLLRYLRDARPACVNAEVPLPAGLTSFSTEPQPAQLRVQFGDEPKEASLMLKLPWPIFRLVLSACVALCVVGGVLLSGIVAVRWLWRMKVGPDVPENPEDRTQLAISGALDRVGFDPKRIWHLVCIDDDARREIITGYITLGGTTSTRKTTASNKWLRVDPELSRDEHCTVAVKVGKEVKLEVYDHNTSNGTLVDNAHLIPNIYTAIGPETIIQAGSMAYRIETRQREVSETDETQPFLAVRS